MVRRKFNQLFFNLWYWVRRPPWDTGVSPPELHRFIERSAPGRALDLGCGTGTNVITLAVHGWDAIGVDFAPKAIRMAKMKKEKAGISASFYTADVTKIDFLEGPFDLILDMGCFHNVPDEGRARYAGQIDRLLSQDGTFLLYTFFRTPENPGPVGLDPAAHSVFSRILQVHHREDGLNRGTRPSAWIWYKKG